MEYHFEGHGEVCRRLFDVGHNLYTDIDNLSSPGCQKLRVEPVILKSPESDDWSSSQPIKGTMYSSSELCFSSRR